jgi:hypothetical protein
MSEIIDKSNFIPQSKIENFSLPDNRFALIVANYDFKDPDIGSLAAPQNDAEAFYNVLSDPKMRQRQSTSTVYLEKMRISWIGFVLTNN